MILDKLTKRLTLFSGYKYLRNQIVIWGETKTIQIGYIVA